jgi:protein TonB
MIYAERMSPSRMVAMAMVVLIHLLVGYVFISGLALRVISQASEDLKTFDVAIPEPPAEAPPAPPPPQGTAEAEPVVAPTPRVPAPSAAPSMSTGEARSTPSGQSARSATLRRGSFDNDRDYPDSARRREEQGTVRVSYTIAADGRVTSCNVVASSGSSALDTTTCRIIRNRFRFSPAMDSNGNPVPETKSQSVRWQLN